MTETNPVDLAHRVEQEDESADGVAERACYSTSASF